MSVLVVYSWGIGSEGQLGHAKFNLVSHLSANLIHCSVVHQTKTWLLSPKTSNVMGSSYRQELPRKMLKSKQYKKLIVGDQCSFAIDQEGKVYGFGKGLVDFEGGDREFKEPIILPVKEKIVDVSVS